MMSHPFDSLRFDNSFVRELPGDPIAINQIRQVRGACYSRVSPTPVSSPTLAGISQEMAKTLGLTESNIAHSSFAEVLGGNEVTESMAPYAACYCGHQFGNWAGQLGDGRAISLGEVVTDSGQRWELQLKGAGMTPYSRSADGRAVIRSSVREFVCSEAMHHLGVPTTRALSLVATEDQVIRDMFYSGHPKPEPGAIVCRVSPSFIRFGTFEMAAAQSDVVLLTQLADYTIKHHFTHLGAPSKDTYLAFFDEVCTRTAELMVHWMRVGFVHGVMNTDNMSILGLTIDYGPYGWLEDYDPSWTPNTTDAQRRRYRYENQPRIGLWNLLQLANALYPLIGEAPPLQECLNRYGQHFEEEHSKMMMRKLGLEPPGFEGDHELIGSLPPLLASAETDMTHFYRCLANLSVSDGQIETLDDRALVATIADAYYAPDDLTELQTQPMAAWLRQYGKRVAGSGVPDELRRTRMNGVNPKFVMRNYLAQLAIDKAEIGDYSGVRELLEVMRHPYDEQPECEEYARKRPEWARNRPGCSMLSCSS